MDSPGQPLAVDTAALLGSLRTEFGVQVMSLSDPAGGHDTEAMVLRGNLVGGESVAIKLSRGGSPAGLYAARLLAGQGVAGVPGPLPARSGLPFSTAGNLLVSVTPWLSGRSGASAPMSAGQWRSFGTLLARVHAARVLPEVQAHLSAEDYDTSIATSLHKLHEAISHHDAGRGGASEIAGGQRQDDALTRALVGQWASTADVLMAIAEQVEALSLRLRARPVSRVLCHGDAHPGNVLIGDDGAVWLLDWDAAILSPRERDLMFVIDGVLADAPVTTEEQSWFFDGYGPTQIDPDRLAYYQGLRALEDTVGWADLVLRPRVQYEERAFALAVFEGSLSPTGIVDRARASLGR